VDGFDPGSGSGSGFGFGFGFEFDSDFDFDFDFDFDLYWCSGLGRMGVEEAWTAGEFEQLESLADQDQSSREVQKSRKQGTGLWRLWRR